MSLRWYQREATDAMLGTGDNDVIVLPTGSGKSHVIKSYIEECDANILILSHVKEILEQNFNLLTGVDNIGLYSAGLGVRHIDRVTVAGIHSVYSNLDLFSGFNKVLIDECHLLNNEGMYHKVVTSLQAQYLGLTATPYRLKQGLIYGDEGMFDHKIYEAPVDKLTEQGFLCPLEYFSDKEKYDVEGIKITGGDYNIKEMSTAFNRKLVTKRIVERVAEYDNKHILVFCIDIDHAKQVAEEMNSVGIHTEAVHSESPRDQAIMDFKAGKINALANVNVLTTGFDYPEVDMIVVMRPTKSLTLHQQMLGRGMRPHPSKTSTLIKDFAGNTARLGTVDDPAPISPPRTGRGSGENPYMKECPECGIIQHPAIRVCKCGYKFKFRHNLSTEANKQVLRRTWYEVTRTYYSIHQKTGSPTSVKVSYACGGRVFNEFVLLEHPGYAGYKAKHWITRRLGRPAPSAAKELVEISSELDTPTHIEVEEGARYPKIIQQRFNTV